MLIIDSHIHCGIQNVTLPFSGVRPLLEKAGITRACLFAPVEDIYYRYSSEISKFLDRYGADRLVFGSDYPFGMPGPQLVQLFHLGIEENDLAKICSGNILRLFDKTGFTS